MNNMNEIGGQLSAIENQVLILSSVVYATKMQKRRNHEK